MDKQNAEPASTTPDRVGRRLHALRAERGLTLEQLAELAGLTRGYLSLLERDLKRPSLAALVRIADGLQTEVSSLFAGQDTSRAEYVLYRHRQSSSDAQTERLPMVPLAASRSGKIMEPFFLSPSFNPLQRVTHSGEELIVVLSGEVVVNLANEELTLGVNDSLYFTASVEHRLRSLGDVRARVLVVVSRGERTRHYVPVATS